MRRIRVGVLFGGRSAEHEVSVASATSILQALDPHKYEAVPIGITRGGDWLVGGSPRRLLENQGTLELTEAGEAGSDGSAHGIVRLENGRLGSRDTSVDVVFPALHGPFGEDGAVQGLLKTANIPFVGADLKACSTCMDKGTMKDLFGFHDLPQVQYLTLLRRELEDDEESVCARVEAYLPYPVFVKPCNLGSSVGISKAGDSGELSDALHLAAHHDRRIIVEEAVIARELECGVLGNDDPIVSVFGEILAHNDWYDYEAKYTQGLADLEIPAKLSKDQERGARSYALRAFEIMDCSGLARIDFFVRRSDGEVLVNEINTMPGFTSTSMFPKLWEASGVPYPELIDRLIQLAFERFEDGQRSSVTV